MSQSWRRGLRSFLSRTAWNRVWSPYPWEAAALAANLLCAGAAGAGSVPDTAPITSTGSTQAVHHAWYSRSIQSDDGLPGNTVIGIAQTLDGFLWVATENGLARWDGSRFHEVARAGSAAPAGSQTTAFLADRRGRIWLGKRTSTADGAVVCVEAGRVRVFTTEDGAPGSQVLEMAEDREGAVWATGGGTVCRIHEGRITSFATSKELPRSSSCHLACDGRGQLWFAQDDRVGVFREGAFRTLLSLKEGSSAICLAGARSGGVWIALGSRVFKFTGEGDPQDLGALSATALDLQGAVLLEDRLGRLWVGTAKAGLFLHNGKGFDEVANVHQEILTLADDREGNLWVGTRGGGLLRVLPLGFDLQALRFGASPEGPISVCQDVGGTLWAVTTSKGVARRDDRAWHLLSREDGWSGQDATCVAAAAGGGVWVGSHLNGLELWHDGTFRLITKQHGLVGNDITALLATTSGDVWIGTLDSNSVQRLRGVEFHTWMLPQIYGHYSSLAMDASGQVWAATQGGVLAQVRGDSLVDMTTNTLGLHCPINSLCATPDGSLWIGYAGCGVGRLKQGRFTRFDREQGLLDDTILQLVADGEGRLWFAADRTLFSVAQSEFDAVTEGRKARLRATGYGREDGLPALQPNKGYWPSALRTADGRLCMSMVSGLLVVEPRLLGRNRQPPPVVIERVVADGRTVAAYQPGEGSAAPGAPPPLDLGISRSPVRLGPGLGQLDLEYAALSYVSPRNVEFKYRLQGLDHDWVEAGSRRVAYYSHLPFGEYRFEVIACNNDGVWNSIGASLAIEVLPQFWETGWFRATCFAGGAFLLVGTGWGIARRRARRRLAQMAQARALDQERARIARDIHDELGARLTQISFLSVMAHDHAADAHEIRTHTGKILGVARDLSHSLHEIVWAARPQNDNLESLLDYLAEALRNLCEGSPVRFWFTGPASVPSMVVSASVRHNILLACTEAINNVLRHSGATEVRVNARLEGQNLRLEITDDGTGFDLAQGEAKRSGLNHIRQRLQEIGGCHEIDTAPTRGTHLKFTVPLGGEGESELPAG